MVSAGENFTINNLIRRSKILLKNKTKNERKKKQN
jgi:hypothetical protein